jgi:hypothetical protein
MAMPTAATGLWIQWPGGKTATLDLPPNPLEIRVSFDGGLQKVR